MKIAVGFDVDGVALRAAVITELMAEGHDVLDLGADSAAAKVDSLEMVRTVAAAVVAGQVERGVLAGSSGLALSLAANRIEGIRAGACSDAYMALQGSAGGMNVLCLGTRTVGKASAAEIVGTFARGFTVHARSDH